MKKTIGTFALLALIVSAAPAKADAWTLHQDISYDIDATNEDASLNTLDVYEPVSGSSRPVVIWVHGGAYVTGDKARTWEKPSLFVQQQNWVLVSINYRLSPYPPAPIPGRVMFPDHQDDVGEAIAWVHRNIAAYKGDPNRILLIGHSAGAHAVALSGANSTYQDRYGVPQSAIRGSSRSTPRFTISLDTLLPALGRRALWDTGPPLGIRLKSRSSHAG